MSHPILVATDGSKAARGAVRMAHGLAARDGNAVQVIAVMGAIPMFDAGLQVAYPEIEVNEGRRKALVASVTAQVEEVTGGVWPMRVVMGPPPQRIVECADDIQAGGIVMGIGRHQPLDRLLGTETALAVMRISHVPILAVPRDCEQLPQRCVAAVDFSEFSKRAVDRASDLLHPPSDLHLVHVMAGFDSLPPGSEHLLEKHRADVLGRLADMTRELAPSSSRAVLSHALEGDPVGQLRAFCEKVDAELLAVGSHGRGFVGRLLTGNVSARLLRGASCSVLMVPPVHLARIHEPTKGSRAFHPDWAGMLERFTQRNAGRASTVEVLHPEIPAQNAASDFPLRGVDYDPKTNRIEIMLGKQGTVEGHLTHSIVSPRSVEILQDQDGNDEAILIELSPGQLLLRFHR